MKVTKFGHACLLIEEGKVRFLIDPGTLSQGFEELQDLSAILLTHQHPDHVDSEKLPALLKANPEAQIVADVETADQLEAKGHTVKAVRQGDEFDIAGVPVSVHGEWHAVIHPSLPKVANVGYLIGDRFFHPGDAYTNPSDVVELLGLPTAGPWARLSDVTDYAMEVKPKIAVPIHDKIMANPATFNGWIGSILKQEGIELISIEEGETVEL